MNNEERKKLAIKWLNYMADELSNSQVGYSLSEEEQEWNNKDLDEIEEAISWVKSKKA